MMKHHVKPKHCIALGCLIFVQLTAWAQVKFNVNGVRINLANAINLVTNHLTIAAGGTVNVVNATVKIGGTITNAGTFDASNGTVEMNGAAAQVIPAAAFTNNIIRNLTINNASGVTLNGSLNLTDVFTVSGGSFYPGGYLTLKSTATQTARVAPVTSNAAIPVNGRVTVERYIPGRRRYRLITSSVTTSTAATLTSGQESLSIWGNWQNSGNNVTPNVGNFITGGIIADGFDTQTANPSLFTYNDVARSYTPFTSANGKNTKYTPLKAGVAFYMFVFGDRRNTVITGSPDNTVINAAGTLLTGNQGYNASSTLPLSTVTGRFTLIGNPFASPINWATIPRTDLANTYWGWDPNLNATGGYITVNTSGIVTLISPFSGVTGLNQYIQSGQGFFVQTTGAAPAMTIREQDKTSYFNASAFRMSSPLAPNSLPLLAVNLLYNNASGKVLADGTLVAFDAGFSIGVGNEDASKLTGSSEILGIVNKADLLSIDARPMPQDKDTLLLHLSNLSKPGYSLQIFGHDMENSNIQPYLEDNFLHTTQLLSLTDTNLVAFNINIYDSASFHKNRFQIVFRQAGALPLMFTAVNAIKNADGIQVNWDVASENNMEKYEVERADDGIAFKKTAQVAASSRSGNKSYHWMDNRPLAGNNYYRIRAIRADAGFFYSKTVVVKSGPVKAEIKVIPNPVTGQEINLQLTGIDIGQYTVTIHNLQGQQVLSRQINFNGGVTNQTLHFTQVVPSGMYFLQIVNHAVRYTQAIQID